MSDFVVEIINQIVILKSTIIATLIGILGFLVTFLILTARFKWTSKNTKLMGFFYTISSKHSIMFASIWIKFFIVVAIVHDGCAVYPAHLFLYALAVILYIVHRHKKVETVLTLINSGVIVFTLYVVQFLHSYIVEIAFNTRIEIILVLIEIFLIVYSLFDLIWSAMNITSDIDLEWDIYKMFDQRSVERQKMQLVRGIRTENRKEELMAEKKKEEDTRRRQQEWANRISGGSK